MAELDAILRKDHKVVDKRDGLHNIMGYIQGDSDKVPIVVDGERPFGIPNERALMGRSLDLHAHLEGYTLATKALPRDATLQEAAAKLAEFRAAYLPVEDERGQLLGYVSAVDVARKLGLPSNARNLAFPVSTLKPDQTIGDALHLFMREYVEYLPVIDERGQVTGVLPRATVLQNSANAGNKGRKDAGGEKIHLLDNPVHGFSENAPAVVKADAPAREVLQTIEDRGYAVVQESDGRAVGIATAETLLRAMGQ